MRVLKTVARTCIAASFATVLLGSAATAQEQAQEVEEVSVIQIECYDRPRYIYDGFERHRRGTETVCHVLFSDGNHIVVVGQTSWA